MLRRPRRQQLDTRSSGGNYLPGLLIVLLVLLQSFELHMCRQLMGVAGQGRGQDIEQESSAEEKRTSVSQPEEIFTAPKDAPDLNYDEYPMVVPKRAALLLDRLMVALHHALENEREGNRIGEFYANKHLAQLKPGEQKNGSPLTTEEGGGNQLGNSHGFHQYSDDDPGVLLDYDFKDLNQINRATGETLMAKSFQRRAGIGVGVGHGATTSGNGNGDAMASAAAAGPGAAPNPGLGLGLGPAGHRRTQHVAHGGGRMYWRCYFNAVSCF